MENNNNVRTGSRRGRGGAGRGRGSIDPGRGGRGRGVADAGRGGRGRGGIARRGTRRDRAVQNNDAPSPFLALPIHVREIILQMCLTTGDGIEFCPEPFPFEPEHDTLWSTSTRRADRRLGDAKAYHFERVRSHIGRHIALLRTSKQLHEEGARVLYGQNEFRFTNTAGWLGLEYFMYNVQMRNVKLLREITIVHPWFLLRPTTGSNAETFFAGLMHWHRISDADRNHPGMGHPRNWFENWTTAGALALLNKIEGFQHIRLLVPREVQESQLQLEQPLDQEIFPNLHVTVAQKIFTSDDPDADEPDVTAQDIADNHNARHGTTWKAEQVFIDCLGGYRTNFLHGRVGRD